MDGENIHSGYSPQAMRPRSHHNTVLEVPSIMFQVRRTILRYEAVPKQLVTH